MTGCLASCNDFLDTLPDKRATLDTPEKIARILISAYPTQMPTVMFEVMSDNYTDNGPLYGVGYSTVEESYLYKNVSASWDCPSNVWSIYGNIASANEALAAIEQLGNPESTRGTKAEALLCRAFGHFILVNTFCIAYNPVSSGTDMGIPYMEVPETTVSPSYERKTVAYVYDKINADIEEALPLLKDNYTQPKYHFNRRAAYAFAARFNLYYGQWDKVVRYATEAIGEDPRAFLRDASLYLDLVTFDERYYAYISVDEPCNFLVLSQRSLWGRYYGSTNTSRCRYAHNRSRAHMTYYQYFPWGGVANGYGFSSGNDLALAYPKVREMFELTNAIAGTGQAHTVLVPFTADETLMCRAEAHAMLGNFDEAARDLSYWYWQNTADHRTYTKEQISVYYSQERTRSPYISLVDSRFNIQPGMQSNLVRAILAARRLEGVHVGLRWPDVKRHGITVLHPVLKSQTEIGTLLSLAPYEKRTAIQLPGEVIAAGLPANPR